MRPIRVRVEGFSAYRSPEEVDFSDVDFFSLSGHTGSGKSSLVDSMIFALFGRVPRLGGNKVEPVITAGADRARVAFDFEASGEIYTAVRVAQRTPSGGATVKEARLQHGEEVLADGADEVTSAVEDLLRLRFDDFVRTVVLPQGEFSRFLTATKAERQGLLRNLLGLDVYTRVRELARTRAAVASDRVEAGRAALADLDVPDEALVAEVRTRLTMIEQLAGEVVESEKRLLTIATDVEAGTARVAKFDDALLRLGEVDGPSNLEAMEGSILTARSALSDAESRLEETQKAVDELQEKNGERPGLSQVESWRKSRARLEDMSSRLAELDLDAAAELVAASESERAEALGRLRDVELSLATTRQSHAAHTLAVSLAIGDECPVCLQIVSSFPSHETPAGLDEMESDEQAYRVRLESVDTQLAEARSAMTRVEVSRAELAQQIEALETELADVPDREGLEALKSEIDAGAIEFADLRAALATAESQRKSADAAHDEAVDRSRKAARELTAAQIKIADLGPPVPESDDVTVQWKELLDWRQQTLDRVVSERKEAETALTSALHDLESRRSELVSRLAEVGVEALEPYAVQVTGRVHELRRQVEEQEKAMQRATGLVAEIEQFGDIAEVAEALARHLRADGFEQWLMSSALANLVQGANDLLLQLSEGGYALYSDDSGTFSIIDHRNADERRSVSTLSGGETFLVSLALALSLAETLAAKGGADLDAIILDEGFGTLDDESLDTVAAVLEELTTRGLMVGVITHVKELAARAPVRYECRRGPSGSTVERL